MFCHARLRHRRHQQQQARELRNEQDRKARAYDRGYVAGRDAVTALARPSGERIYLGTPPRYGRVVIVPLREEPQYDCSDRAIAAAVAATRQHVTYEAVFEAEEFTTRDPTTGLESKCRVEWHKWRRV